MAGRAFVSRFSPSRTDPEVLEAIFVQRHRLAEVWLERLRDGVLTEVKHHLLAVGPRGCGKSHLVALLVSRLRKDPAVRERVRIAWLPEDETTPSFWKFLLRILRALNAEYGDEFPPPPRDPLAGATNDRRSAVLTDYLLKKLDGRTLLVVVENLDDVMRGLKGEGQKRWRAFLQEHPVAGTLATAQQLTEDVSDRDRPFFNFFQVEHLLPLSADEALSLLRKIAEHNNNTSLVAFLQTPTGRARVRAIRHIAGGSHRVFIILSEFATRENLDDLVTAFEELLDELTPYYQERLRWLPDQQREIVEFLCRQARTVPVKEIAGELFLSEQTAGAQLKQLKDKGYVTAGSVGRESRYELAEPLMRLCVEVKDPHREPIRLIVEFLRVWYDRAGLEARLQCLPMDADLQRRHFQAALQADRPGIPGPVAAALNQDLEAARAIGDQAEVVRVLVELAATADSSWQCCAIARELSDLGRNVEALAACDRATALDPNSASAWLWKGSVLNNLGRNVEALAACDRATALDPNSASAWLFKGRTLTDLGRNVEALAACDRAIELDPNSASVWFFKGLVLNNLGRHAEALTACDRATELDPNSDWAWAWKGLVLNNLYRHAEALAACDRVTELRPKNPLGWVVRFGAKSGLGRIDEGIQELSLEIALNTGSARMFDSLAEAYVLQGNWAEAERTLSQLFRLPLSPSNPATSEHFPDFIEAIFRASTDRKVWAHRVSRVADIAREAQQDREKRNAYEKAKPPPLSEEIAGPPSPPNPLAMLGDSLVRSLTKTAYAEAPADALDAWAGVWQEVAERHPDLLLATRLFGVGVRYLRTKDERVLLDLVREERSILRDLFELDGGTDEG
jgi:tetratricopeptide (TPR) repeat protein